jgi:hypothetical protein
MPFPEAPNGATMLTGTMAAARRGHVSAAGNLGVAMVPHFVNVLESREHEPRWIRD